MRNLRTFLTKHSYLVLTLLCFFGLQYAGNMKLYLILMMSYGASLFLLTPMNITEVLFLLLLVNLPIEKGLRDWTIPIVSHGSEPWMRGYNLYFGVTVKMIISATLALSLLSKDTRHIKSISVSTWALIFFVAISAISSIMAPDPPLAFLGFLRLGQSVLIFFVAQHMFSSIHMRRYFFSFVTACLLFLGYVGTKQFFLGHSLGLYFEDSIGSAPFGYQTTDGPGLNRVSGLSGHPTFFASLLSLFIPIVFSIVIIGWKAFSFSSLMPLLSFFLGVTALIGTLSRSGWLATVLALGAYSSWLLRNKSFRIFHRVMITLGLLCLLVFIPLAPFIIERAATFIRPWDLSSGQVRIQLALQAITMITSHPFLGVGLNHFTRVLVSTKLPEIIQNFIYPVHNTWLLFASELGVPATLSFVFFVSSIFYHSFRKIIKSGRLFGVWLGAMTFIISSQFHTLFNQDPTLDIFMVLLGLLSVL